MGTAQESPSVDQPNATTTAPPPPPLYTPEQRQVDPVFTEFKEKIAEKATERIKLAEDRMNDVPVEYEIGGETYVYTSRPLGYLNLILEEFMSLRTIFDDLRKAVFAEIESGALNDDGTEKVQVTGEESKPLVTPDDVNEFFVNNGKAGIAVMVRIAQLLVEPIDKTAPGPPPTTLKLTAKAAEWGMTSITFSKMLSEFFSRDLMTSGDKLKNLIGLGPAS